MYFCALVCSDRFWYAAAYSRLSCRKFFKKASNSMTWAPLVTFLWVHKCLIPSKNVPVLSYKYTEFCSHLTNQTVTATVTRCYTYIITLKEHLVWHNKGLQMILIWWGHHPFIFGMDSSSSSFSSCAAWVCLLNGEILFGSFRKSVFQC